MNNETFDWGCLFLFVIVAAVACVMLQHGVGDVSVR